MHAAPAPARRASHAACCRRTMPQVHLRAEMHPDERIERYVYRLDARRGAQRRCGAESRSRADVRAAALLPMMLSAAAIRQRTRYDSRGALDADGAMAL